MKRLLVLALSAVLLSFMLVLPAVSAPQFSGEPLVGPFIATVPVAADRIILYDVGADTRRELRFGDAEHAVWDFSPDGCRVLFTLNDGSTPGKLYTARLDGSDTREVVQYAELPPDSWGVWEPDWSPDGSRIAFTMIRETALLDAAAPQAEDNPYEYRIARVPGEGGAPEFYSVSGDEHSPQWSPDGAWLAYAAYEARVPGADPSSTAVPTDVPPPDVVLPPLPLIREADLWVVSADGEEKYRLTYFDTGSIGTPRWSPDGNLIGFVYSPIGNNDQFWMIGNRPGALATQLSAQWALALDLTWLPDSTAMLAAVREFRDETMNRLWRVPLVGIADTDATLLVEDPALSYVDFPRFSADGRWLAVRSAYALALLDTEAMTWELLDEGTLGNGPPVWSPPGFEGEAACT